MIKQDRNLSAAGEVNPAAAGLWVKTVWDRLEMTTGEFGHHMPGDYGPGGRIDRRAAAAPAMPGNGRAEGGAGAKNVYLERGRTGFRVSGATNQGFAGMW